MSDSHLPSGVSGGGGGSGEKRGSGLFLTLPSNFSPGSRSGSPRNSLGGGGTSGIAPSPLGQSNKQQAGSTTSRLSPSSSLTHCQQHHHTPSHNYGWEDLRRLFLISLEKMFRLEPESIPFRQPVDPVALGIPDYFDIIRKPMDLQTIRNKMNTGKYTDAWAYVDDVLRMLDNAWVYNREVSKISQYATRLSEVFQKEVNPVMYHLGYKRGRSNSFHFNSDVLNCHGRPVCIVPKGAGYWRDPTRDMEFNLCEPCYSVWMSEQKEEELMATDKHHSSSTPDVILNATNNQQQQKCSEGDAPTHHQSSSSPCRSEFLDNSFVFTVNQCKSYSPAAEIHKSHVADAEMSRQLVLREFLRMLLASDTTTETKQNVYKMLRCNGKLCTELVKYVKRRRSVVMGDRRRNSRHSEEEGYSSSDDGGSCYVYGESFTTKDLDLLLEKLKGLSISSTTAGPASTTSGRTASSASPSPPTTMTSSGGDKTSHTTTTTTTTVVDLEVVESTERDGQSTISSLGSMGMEETETLIELSSSTSFQSETDADGASCCSGSGNGSFTMLE